MAVRNFLQSSQRHFFQSLRSTNIATNKRQALQYSKQTSNAKTEKEIDDLDQPVQFTSSKASQWSSSEPVDSRHRTNRPEFEYLIVKVSLAAFLLYFCILREENDWDVGIYDDIYSKVPDLELVVLRQKKKDANAGGRTFSVEDELRMKELEKELGLKRK